MGSFLGSLIILLLIWIKIFNAKVRPNKMLKLILIMNDDDNDGGGG